jgi:hypothetical protein
LGLRLTETPEAPDTIMVDNSLSFLMAHHMSPIGWRFMSYDCRKLDRSAEQKSGQTIPLGISQGFGKIWP